MTPNPSTSWRSDLAWYLGLTIVTGGAFWISAGPVAGILAASGMLAFTLLLSVGRRRIDALRVIGGAGDERNRALYTQSLATSGAILGLVVTGWFLVGVARGEADPVLLTLTLLFAASFVASGAFDASRG
jgi:hypothetical protein